MTDHLHAHPREPRPDGIDRAREVADRTPGAEYIPDNWVDGPLCLVAFGDEYVKHEQCMLSYAWPVVTYAQRRPNIMLAPRLATKIVAYVSDWAVGPYEIPDEHQTLFRDQRELMLDTIRALMRLRGMDAFGRVAEALIAMLDKCVSTGRQIDAGVLRAFVVMCERVDVEHLAAIADAPALI